MNFTVDATMTVDVSLRDLPAALRHARAGNLDKLLARVDVVDSDFSFSR